METYQDRLIADATDAADKKDRRLAFNLCTQSLTMASDAHRQSLGWLCVGYSSLKSGELDGAQKALQEATKQDPNHFAIHYLAAMIFEEEKEPREALTEYKKAKTFSPNDERLETGIKRCEAALHAQK